MNNRSGSGVSERWARPWGGALVSILSIALLVGCAAQKKRKGEEVVLQAGAGRSISAITTSRTPLGETVRLVGNGQLTFTSIKQPVPPGVILYLPDTRIATVPQPVGADHDIVAFISAEVMPENPGTARVAVRLKRDAPYEVKSDGNTLLVTFPDSVAGTEPAAAPIAPASAVSEEPIPAREPAIVPVSLNTEAETRRFKGIKKGPDGEVRIEADGTITRFNTFTLDSPPRIVVDVFDLADLPAAREQVLTMGADWARKVRFYGDDAKLRVVIDTDAAYLARYEALPMDAGLRVRPLALAARADQTEKPAPAPVKEEPVPAENAPPAAAEPQYTGEKIALDFFDTDIRNVFRILGEVSQQNFAVDKDVAGRVTLNLGDPVPWDQVLDLVLKMNQLDKQVDGNVVRIATIKTLEAEQQAREKKLVAEKRRKMAETLKTEHIPVNYANAETEVLPLLTPFFEDSAATGNQSAGQTAEIKDPGNVNVDSRNNVIIITAMPETIERAREIVAKVDQVVPQVMIEARIVEANTNFSRDIGIAWATNIGILGDDPRAGIGPQRGFDRWEGTYGWDSVINLPAPEGSPSLGFNFTKIIGSPFILDAQLTAMETNGDGKVVSSPRIMTLNKQEAEIKQGFEIPYAVKGDEGDVTVEFKQVELVLRVTPQITPDKRVSLAIHVVKKELAGTFYTEQVGETPYLSNREAKTNLLVNDGETVAIGGIAQTSVRDENTGVPWLSQIPLIGWLFKNTSKDNEKQELLIFLTPQINQLEQRMPEIDGTVAHTPKTF